MYSCYVFLACVKGAGALNSCRSLDCNHTSIPFSSDPPPDPCPSSPLPPQVRGLGGANVLDYTEDRTPVVSLCQEDYINFWGQRVDATFVNVTDADVAVGVGQGLAGCCLPRRGHVRLLACVSGVPPSHLFLASSLLNPSHTVCFLPATLAWPFCDKQAAAIHLLTTCFSPAAPHLPCFELLNSDVVTPSDPANRRPLHARSLRPATELTLSCWRARATAT